MVRVSCPALTARLAAATLPVRRVVRVAAAHSTNRRCGQPARLQPTTRREAPHRPNLAVAAQGAGGGSGGPPREPSAAAQLVASPLYRVWLQLGVVVLLLMLIDAGFSGDWSRIGAITTDQEAQLRQVAAGVGVFHLACGAAAAAASSQRSENWLPRTAKVLAVGLLALVEVLLLPEAEQGA